MPRYFLEVSYKGTNYSGFQVQKNVKTIQSEVEKALQILYKQPFSLTGSSRTDTGVHALQNFFHFDTELFIEPKQVYNLNSILPLDISAKGVYKVNGNAHCRFGALAREYKYFIYNYKNPFLQDRAWYYPYKVNKDLLYLAAQLIAKQQNFISFSKQKTQVKNFLCCIEESQWVEEDDNIIYTIRANRFLRGMVRALVSSQLKVARGTMGFEEFQLLFTHPLQSSADFSAPPQGLFLTKVIYPLGYYQQFP
jgi:tRNA pseudouridine38-40 synthase